MSRTRLYLVRHCDVQNPQSVIYGHLPGFPLSELGVRQGKELGRFFAGSGIAQIVTSPLQRARQTAELLASQLPDVPILTSEDLVEAEFGRYLQGVPYAQIAWRRPLWWIHHAHRGLLRGDESAATMASRVERQLRRLLQDEPVAGGVCVSHGDPIEAFWVTHNGGTGFRSLNCDKGGMLVLDYHDLALTTLTYLSPAEVAATSAPKLTPAPS